MKYFKLIGIFLAFNFPSYGQLASVEKGISLQGRTDLGYFSEFLIRPDESLEFQVIGGYSYYNGVISGYDRSRIHGPFFGGGVSYSFPQIFQSYRFILFPNIESRWRIGVRGGGGVMTVSAKGARNSFLVNGLQDFVQYEGVPFAFAEVYLGTQSIYFDRVVLEFYPVIISYNDHYPLPNVDPNLTPVGGYINMLELNDFGINYNLGLGIAYLFD